MTSDGHHEPVSRPGAVFGFKPGAVFAVTLAASALVYFYRLGGGALGASEAYSAWAAAKPSVRAIVSIPVLLDPGKQVFYYVVLHYFSRVFGLGEASVRALSALSALAALALLFALGRAMFSEPVAAVATVLWAFNPIIVIFSHRARMYPMFVAAALAHLILLWRIRFTGDWRRTLGCGVAGAVAVYTHLAALVLIGAEAAMLARDAHLGRRAKAPWIALAIALLLFAPYLPVFLVQYRTLVYGHWLDWIGTPHNYPAATRAVAVALAAALGLAFVFGPALEAGAGEPLRWCVAWSVLPLVAFVAGSIAIRPMLHIRYLVPCLATGVLAAARLLESLGSRIRNLTAAGFTVAMLMGMPYFLPGDELWPRIAAEIAAGGAPGEPVFFESGFLSPGVAARSSNGGFPDGYYRIPFDYYFHGPNPRVVVPGLDPGAARKTITKLVAEARGGWLVTWKEEPAARAELPDSSTFTTVERLRAPVLALYRIGPRAAAVAPGR